MITIRLPRTAASVTPLTADEVAALILTRGSRAEKPLVLGNLNLHALYLYETNWNFRVYCDLADLVIIDGWPILALARLKGAKVTKHHRVGSTDWLQQLLRRNNKSHLNVVAIGGTPDTARRAKRSIENSFPSVRWAAYDGYTDWTRRQACESTYSSLISDLEAADLVLVGMGMPKQEQWITENLHLAGHAVIANVGGCIDYLAGAQDLAPRWLGPLGLEWAYRLVRNPRRLWRRYLVEPVLLLRLLLRSGASVRTGHTRKRPS